MKSFEDILNKSVADIEKPKPRPLGTYIAAVTNFPKQKTVQEKPILDYMFKLTAPQTLNDPDMAAEIGDITAWAPLTKSFWLDTEEGEYAHRQFLVNTLGIDPGPEGSPKSIKQLVAESPGKMVLVTLKHRPYTDSNNEAQIATDIGVVSKL